MIYILIATIFAQEPKIDFITEVRGIEQNVRNQINIKSKYADTVRIICLQRKHKTIVELKSVMEHIDDQYEVSSPSIDSERMYTSKMRIILEKALDLEAAAEKCKATVSADNTNVSTLEAPLVLPVVDFDNVFNRPLGSVEANLDDEIGVISSSPF